MFRSEEEIETLVRSFEDCTIDTAKWSHAAHVATAVYYVARFGEAEGTRRMRDGLLRFVAFHGVTPSPNRGYNETITRVWMRIVAHYVEDAGAGSPLAELANGCIERYARRETLQAHYTSERLWSDEARLGWVEPDLAPLP
jgi:hypothetical protein